MCRFSGKAVKCFSFWFLLVLFFYFKYRMILIELIKTQFWTKFSYSYNYLRFTLDFNILYFCMWWRHHRLQKLGIWMILCGYIKETITVWVSRMEKDGQQLIRRRPEIVSIYYSSFWSTTEVKWDALSLNFLLQYLTNAIITNEKFYS